MNHILYNFQLAKALSYETIIEKKTGRTRIELEGLDHKKSLFSTPGLFSSLFQYVLVSPSGGE